MDGSEIFESETCGNGDVGGLRQRGTAIAVECAQPEEGEEIGIDETGVLLFDPRARMYRLRLGHQSQGFGDGRKILTQKRCRDKAGTGDFFGRATGERPGLVEPVEAAGFGQVGIIVRLVAHDQRHRQKDRKAEREAGKIDRRIEPMPRKPTQKRGDHAVAPIPDRRGRQSDMKRDFAHLFEIKRNFRVLSVRGVRIRTVGDTAMRAKPEPAGDRATRCGRGASDRRPDFRKVRFARPDQETGL